MRPTEIFPRGMKRGGGEGDASHHPLPPSHRRGRPPCVPLQVPRMLLAPAGHRLFLFRAGWLSDDFEVSKIRMHGV